MERSAHVREQINELEEQVLRAQWTYNELRAERKRREIALERLIDTHAFLSIGDKAVSVTERLSSLSKQLQNAQNQLESERAATETLEYMIAERRKQIAFRAAPTVPMQRKLKSVTALKEGNSGLVTKAEMELKTRLMRIKDLKGDFMKQKSRNSGLLEALLEQHAYRTEFEALSSEHRLQLQLRSRLDTKERNMTQLSFTLAAATAHEKKRKEIAEQQAALDRMEATIDTITAAAKTESSAGILDYWNFLKESQEYLKATANTLEDRIFQANFEVKEGRNELEQAISRLSSSHTVTTIMTEIEGKQLSASQMLESRQAKVRSKQVAWFTGLEARLRVALTHMLGRVQGGGEGEESVVRLLESLETALRALLPKNS